MASRILYALICCALLAQPAAAQHLRDRLRELFTFGSCGRPLCLDGSVSAANGHGDHFLPDLIASNSAVIGFLTDAIGINAANTPISATGGGITYKFVGGLPVKTSESAGPIFAERAQTLGRGRFVLGANLTGSSFRSLRGTPLDRIIINFTHQDVGTPGLGDPLLENDVLEVHLALDVSLLVTTLFATYGLSDAIDVGVAVPVVHTSIQGRSEGEVRPFGSTAVHFFTGTSTDPGLRATSATFGSATGIGDLALRVKANLGSVERLAVALMGDVRFPTGDERDLLGSGHLAIRTLAILSGRFGDFRPHANLGYQLRTGARRADALLATVGFEQPLNPWTTIVVDLITEWESGTGELELPGTVRFQFPFARSVEPTNIPNGKDHRVGGSLGFKFRTSDRGPRVVTNAVVPLRQGGLLPAVMWTGGLEFNF
ncbi:MAG: transporter [Gemmatimonadales bacterium]